MKKLYCFMIIILLLVLFLGHGYVKKTNQEYQHSKVYETDNKHINDVYDYKYPSDCNIYSITYKEFDINKACTLLLHDSNGQIIPEKKDNGLIYIENNSEVLAAINGRLDYSKDVSSSDIEVFIMDYIFNFKGKNNIELNTESEVDIQSLKYVENILTELYLDTSESFILKKVFKKNKKELYEIMNNLKTQTNAYVSDNISYNYDDYTCLLYEIEMDSIPLMGICEPVQEYAVDVYGSMPTYINILLGDNQIICIDSQGLIQHLSSEKNNLLSYTKAIDYVEKNYYDILGKKNYEISDIRLEYLVIPDYSKLVYAPDKLVPYWILYQKDQEDNIITTRINAVTGGDLLYGE